MAEEWDMELTFFQKHSQKKKKSMCRTIHTEPLLNIDRRSPERVRKLPPN